MLQTLPMICNISVGLGVTRIQPNAPGRIIMETNPSGGPTVPDSAMSVCVGMKHSHLFFQIVTSHQNFSDRNQHMAVI
ncbi:hypothetical protein XELAEV_18026437mg [Xenopus laevis]|uniref:Uncharacterized protein n=1 Tax=Xenopus laevis TaxID=8355 RepID=A0A974CTS0_XENLA|nr:hypothetical protein XELAEV_18026437mg [Xenopus laevis]